MYTASFSGGILTILPSSLSPGTNRNSCIYAYCPENQAPLKCSMHPVLLPAMRFPTSQPLLRSEGNSQALTSIALSPGKGQSIYQLHLNIRCALMLCLSPFGCYNRRLQSGWLINNIYFLQFRGWEVQVQGTSRLDAC